MKGPLNSKRAFVRFRDRASNLAFLSPLKGRRGSLLLEVLIASMVMTLVGGAVLGGLSLSHRSGAKVEQHSVAENIARNQMEYVYSQPYLTSPSTYASVSAPPGYSARAAGSEFVAGDPNVQKVVTTVSRDGQDILVLEAVRVKPR